jgi:predicted Zn-dependent peptidase
LLLAARGYAGLGAVLVFALLWRPAVAQEPQLDVREHTLANGMRVLIVPRRGAPTFSAHLRFNVGSVHESPGRTGLAHFLEHLMFKGTRWIGTRDPDAEIAFLDASERLRERVAAERARPGGGDAQQIAQWEDRIGALEAQAKGYVVKNEWWEIYRRNGGVRLNASTGRDSTQYFVSLPKNRLVLWARVEADRMRDPVFREFYSERDVVLEERRQRVETRPEGKLYETLFGTAFACLPYRHPIIGYEPDIRGLTRAAAAEFFRVHYAPNNAVLVLVGDLEPEETLRIVREHFETIPRQEAALPVRRDCEAEPPGERREAVPFPAQPRTVIAYRTPPYGHPDRPGLGVLAMILGDGRTSRLNQRIVEGDRTAFRASAGHFAMQHAGLFVVEGSPRAPNTSEELERALLREVDRLAAEPVSEEELERVRAQLDGAAIRTMQADGALASLLAVAQAQAGDWRYFLEARRRAKATTAADLQRLARQYLSATNRTVATLVPTGEAPRPPAGGADPGERPHGPR